MAQQQHAIPECCQIPSWQQPAIQQPAARRQAMQHSQAWQQRQLVKATGVGPQQPQVHPESEPHHPLLARNPTRYSWFLQALRQWCKAHNVNFRAMSDVLKQFIEAVEALWQLLLELEAAGWVLLLEDDKEGTYKASGKPVYVRTIRGIVYPNGQAAAALAAVQEQQQLSKQQARMVLLKNEEYVGVLASNTAHAKEEAKFEAQFDQPRFV